MSKEETKLDDDGQETEVTYYGYDHENRLTSLEYVGDQENILNASFEYDGNGLRTKATEGSIITKYYYDGLNPIIEKNNAGLTAKSYTRALGFPGGIGGLISLKRFEQDDDGLEEKTSYYHYDALGSVRGLSNEKGNLSAEFNYDAFGNGKNNKKWNTYRFSSKEFEDHAGLYFFGARYYDPEIGRWLTPDPLGSVDGPNVFLYVKNNPINLIDPYGEFAFLALLPIAYAAFEVGLSALDVYSTASTLLDSSASGKEKALSAGLFIAGALAPGGGYSTGAKFTQGQLKQFEKQLAQHGKGSLEKSLASFQKNLFEHQKKLEGIKEAGGYTSSVEKEINNFIQQINAIKKILGGG